MKNALTSEPRGLAVRIEYRESSLKLGEHREWLKYNKRYLGSDIIEKIENNVLDEKFWPSEKSSLEC